MSSTLFEKDRLILLQNIHSTNDYAWELLSTLPSEGTVIQALEQSKGRGQKGNVWESEPGKNLLMSLIVQPHWLPSYRLYDLSIITSLALVQLFDHMLTSNQSISIKWPNDILVGKKKICGILIENQLEGKYLKYSVIGVGLNVNQTTFSSQLQPNVTSIKLQLGIEYPLDEVRKLFMRSFEKLYTRLKSNERISLKNEYLTYLWGFGQQCRLQINHSIQLAKIKGVDEAGRLITEINDQECLFNNKEAIWVDL